MQVTLMERISIPQLFSTTVRHGWSADVTLDDGSHLSVSRFDDETDWLADSLFSSIGYPYFSHGTGARDCAKRAADGDLAALLDSEREARA